MPEQKKGLPQRSKTKSPRPANTVEPDSRLSVGSRSFSPKKPDWDYWKKFDLWTLGQAVCLICSCEPEGLESYDHPLSPRFRSNIYESKKSKELRRLYELALNSLEAGSLTPFDHNESLDANFNTRIKPGKFIKWAIKKGVNIPDELEILARGVILDGHEVDTDHPTLKRLEELEGQEFKNNPPQKKTSQIPSDSELLKNPDRWMTYGELKERWGNRSDQEFILLMANIGLTAFKGNFPPLSCKPEAADLKDCYFIRFHVDHLEREHPKLIRRSDRASTETSSQGTVRKPRSKPRNAVYTAAAERAVVVIQDHIHDDILPSTRKKKLQILKDDKKFMKIIAALDDVKDSTLIRRLNEAHRGLWQMRKSNSKKEQRESNKKYRKKSIYRLS